MKKFLIICAMQSEMDAVIQSLNPHALLQKHKFLSYTQFIYNNQQIMIMLCGIGKVNAATHTQAAIDFYQPDLIANIGVAGSLSHKVNFGDVVIANALVQYDFDLTEFGRPLGQIPNFENGFQAPQSLNMGGVNLDYSIHYGIIASGDKFINDAPLAASINQTFDALCCEMEGAAIAQVASLNNLDYLIIRSISDLAGQQNLDAKHSFNELTTMAALRASQIVQYILSNK